MSDGASRNIKVLVSSNEVDVVVVVVVVAVGREMAGPFADSSSPTYPSLCPMARIVGVVVEVDTDADG
jgi:hypothetical protein